MGETLCIRRDKGVGRASRLPQWASRPRRATVRSFARRPQLGRGPSVPLMLASLVMILFATPVPAQIGGVYKGFKLPYYDRTTGKLKGQSTGAEAQPQKNGVDLLVQKARIEDYLEDGSTNLTATTRECFVDPKNRVAFSAGRLEV